MWVEKVADISYTFVLAFDWSLSVPSQVQQGTATTISGTITMDPAESVLRVDFTVGITIHVNVSWFKKEIPLVQSGYFFVDASGVGVTFGSQRFTWDGVERDFDLGAIGISLAFTPKLFGTIFEATITFSFFTFLETYLAMNPLFQVIKFFISDIQYQMVISLVGSIQGSILANGESLSAFTFNDATMLSHSFTSTHVPSQPRLVVAAGDFSYGLVLAVEHFVVLEFASWLGYLFGLDTQICSLGTFPTLSASFPLTIPDIVMFDSAAS